ncbi:unnamed protein product [Paramecium pentaurelia]|uniref:Uncharacterized protein n=1 Tax=Paramecium pentaurelia TaxID=43138 RepID=A0A8S1XT69_9CILI|nr:unnamed protein product [Paramecium pentaurelia]
MQRRIYSLKNSLRKDGQQIQQIRLMDRQNQIYWNKQFYFDWTIDNERHLMIMKKTFTNMHKLYIDLYKRSETIEVEDNLYLVQRIVNGAVNKFCQMKQVLNWVSCTFTTANRPEFGWKQNQYFHNLTQPHNKYIRSIEVQVQLMNNFFSEYLTLFFNKSTLSNQTFNEYKQKFIYFIFILIQLRSEIFCIELR